MAAKRKTGKKVLGRGLKALVSSKPVAVKSVKKTEDKKTSTKASKKSPDNFLDIKLLSNNTEQPRKEFDEKKLQELSDSILKLGILQPIICKKTGKDSYEIIAGERRWRAAKLAKLKQVPVIIKDLSDREAKEIALVENIQRSDLNPLETALAYQAIIDEFSLTQQELAERVGKERASVANTLRILNLPSEIQELLKSGKITMGHAKAILTVKEPSAQKGLAKKVINEGLSVRQLEQIVSRVVVLKPGKKAKKAKTSEYPELEDLLRKSLGTKVAIQSSKEGKGKIEVEYYSEDELDRLTEIMCR
ncbi:UNVERIFIED_CONTAM: hypothetical protein GTU68_005296 [Idotea baltica]|nr:hypothetical protein [Idotea baltica]